MVASTAESVRDLPVNNNPHLIQAPGDEYARLGWEDLCRSLIDAGQEELDRILRDALLHSY